MIELLSVLAFVVGLFFGVLMGIGMYIHAPEKQVKAFIALMIFFWVVASLLK
jgi:uncharacterized membrane protein YfcA